MTEINGVCLQFKKITDSKYHGMNVEVIWEYIGRKWSYYAYKMFTVTTEALLK